MNSNTKRPPQEVSRKLKGAITQALREERVPKSRRWIKTAVATICCTVILALPLFLVFREQMNLAWKIGLIVWATSLFVAFSMYYRPQPRLAVPGFWSPWIFSRVLLTMVAMTVAEILICPSFVFLHSPLGWAPFEPLTRWLMMTGGMPLCMLVCGLIFASVGGLLTFYTIAKTLKGSSTSDLLKAVGLAMLSQLPIMLIQVWDPGLRPFVGHWVCGAFLGVATMAWTVRLLTSRF